ncbi:MAG: 3-oxoacyl-(acyl carrier protein) synthase [Mucilaginibacter sp.]|nr:3-oxoacyl-(acyl carrier protein) synthase [Mucilaginibacter sp.]
MKIYIRSAATISAQKTFGDVPFLTEPVEYEGTRLKAIEPDYKDYIDPKQIRRMSHIIKMGVAAARECLTQAKIEIPDAIITGTAYGCLEDTITFLTRIIELEEEMLPPTAFIQSTHNTVAAQIALLLKCHQYNNTFVHKGISFESALLDAIMLINENEAAHVLVGGTDEMTDASFAILTRLGLYKRWPLSNLSLFKTRSNGSIGGEGAAFFLLTDKASADNMAELVNTKTFYKPKSNEAIELNIKNFLADNALEPKDIDLVITGRNGDLRNDAIYDSLNNSLFANSSLANYKHLCGEYPTSVSFALWVASNVIKRGTVPVVIAESVIKNPSPKKVLIYNHYQNNSHSLMLVSSC